MQAFKAPKSALGEIDAEAAASLIAAAADIALILDDQGIIQDISIASAELARDLDQPSHWVGRAWADFVTGESRAKVAALIADAGSERHARWRHLNHPAPSGPDIPITYAVVRTGSPQRLVAFGRDLRAVSVMQRRLAEAQQSMEREYAQTRLAETRYRLLFQVAADPLLMLDAPTRNVLDSNPAARRLFAAGAEPGSRWQAETVFTPASVRSIDQLLAVVQASGRPDNVRARLQNADKPAVVSASPVREAGRITCLVRISAPHTAADSDLVPKLKAKLLKLIDGAPDGFVVTGEDGRIVTANAAFLDLVQVPTEEQARGKLLDSWVGRSSVDLDVLTANVRQRGSVRLFATTLRSEIGRTTDVEISAVRVMNGGQPCFGFAIRDIGPRIPEGPRSERMLPRSLENMTKLIGQISLRELVREATDVIERLCIEAALELTGNNRASAAELLGLSRQSLYAKLHRYGLGDPADAGAD